jgi:hypothetical protein
MIWAHCFLHVTWMPWQIAYRTQQVTSSSSQGGMRKGRGFSQSERETQSGAWKWNGAISIGLVRRLISVHPLGGLV